MSPAFGGKPSRRLGAAAGVATNERTKMREEGRARDITASARDITASGPDVAASGPDVEHVLANLRDCVVYRLLVETGPDGEANRRLLYVSRSLERLFGLQVEDALADVTRWYALLVEEDFERVIAAEAAALETEARFEVEAAFRVPSGIRVFSITSTPTRLGSDVIQWDGVAMDVTDRVEARRARERLAMMVENSEDYAAIQTVEGTCVFLNAAGRRLRGLPDDVDLSTLDVHDRHPPQEAERMGREVLPHVLKHGARWSGRSTRPSAGARRARCPVQATIIAHRGTDGQVTHLSAIMRDLREREASDRELRRAGEETETALREVSHRVKNLFALVPALITLSARGKTDVGEVVQSVQDRVLALARSHAMTINTFSQDKGVALDALIRAVLEPYQNRTDAFQLDGPAVRLASRDGNAMALMLHELATNAAKYGALTASKGRITISWRITPGAGGSGADPSDKPLDLLDFRWKERGGPPVAEPASSGFGTRLIDRMILQQSGRVSREWQEQGVVVDVTLPLHHYAAGAAAASSKQA